jgi:UDP-N-acetylmuramyl pentapeptide phosphotransferase/UDP-N-acetylglucosamine-1-phosphate transferase
MSVLLAALVGAAAARVLLLALRHVLAAPVLVRENFRGRTLPTAAGLVVVLAVVFVESARSTLAVLGVDRDGAANPYRPPVLFAAVGFGFLGLVDDLLATGDDRGFRGHLRALRHGRLTTGSVKLFGGAALALFLAAPGNPVSGVRLLADAVLIALAANLANLFDRAPGRVLKLGAIAWLPLAIAAGLAGASTDARLAGVPVAVAMGAALALLPDDLGERLMLGDAGANIVGAVLGLQVVLATNRTTRNGVLVLLVVLNLASERISFSRVIDRVAPLRALDRLGRRP